QETYALFIKGIFLNGNILMKTETGLEIRIITTLIIRPGIAIGISSVVFISKSVVRNMISWKIKERPSKKLSEERLCTNFELPITSPAMYTAKNPLPFRK